MYAIISVPHYSRITNRCLAQAKKQKDNKKSVAPERDTLCYVVSLTVTTPFTYVLPDLIKLLYTVQCIQYIQ